MGTLCFLAQVSQASSEITYDVDEHRSFKLVHGQIQLMVDGVPVQSQSSNVHPAKQAMFLKRYSKLGREITTKSGHVINTPHEIFLDLKSRLYDSSVKRSDSGHVTHKWIPKTQSWQLNSA